MSREISPSAFAATAVVVAAGEGTRLGASLPKALVALHGRPMLEWSLGALDDCPDVSDIVIVAAADYLSGFVRTTKGLRTPCRVVAGGATRAESVARGLGAMAHSSAYVLVHDAARPLLTSAMVTAVLEGIGDHWGAILAAPLADTVKRVGDDGVIAGSPSRAGLWGAQTPQAFHADALVDAVAVAQARGTIAAATDCASLVEAAGGTVGVVDPGAPNMKVTTPADLELVAALLAARSARAGVG